ncbi:MAG: 30S ribosomal protein S24e [Candidatus Micrarchaeia archaeon]
MNAKMEITGKNRNELFKRTEVTAIKHSNAATPKRSDLLQELAGDLKAPAANIVIDRVEQHFGSKTVVVHAKAYDSPEALKKIEREYKSVRTHGKKQEEKKG